MLPESLFKNIVRHSPLISIDFIVKNSSDKVLLGKRNNRPAKGFWFVPGGRIRKGERLFQAFSRLSMAELGMRLDIERSVFLGAYEHHYQENFSDDDFSTHYIVLAFEVNLETGIRGLPDEQHAEYKWYSIPEILRLDDVHHYTKAYFLEDRNLNSKHAVKCSIK